MASSSNPFANCTSITPTCPAEYTPLTYVPDIIPNFVYLVIFIVCAIVQFVLSIWFRTWTYGFAVCAGCVLEFLGYLARAKMHSNPWDSGAFLVQGVTLIIAPAFLSAGVYLTLKHVVLTFGREYSILKPTLYTWIFVCADIFSLLVQAAGAALFGGHNSISVIKAGADIALAGIVFQVFSLAVFGLLATLYLVRLSKHWGQLSPETLRVAHSTKTHFFAAAVVIAYITILARCIYRIPELAGGYRNPVYGDQASFIVMEGVMISIAAICLTLIHPGIFFPMIKPSYRRKHQQQSPEQYIELDHGSNKY